MSDKAISLSTLNKLIRKATDNAFPNSIWLIAEVLEMNTNRSGHCYMELIEKDSNSNAILAKSRATIWAFKFKMLRPYFENTTGNRFEAGIKALFKVNISFHEVYGFSLNITDIDPTYTLGDMARKKLEIIKKIKESGIGEMNKELEIPHVPQRIAVISSETAAGYGDFLDSLHDNSHGFVFYTELFPALMQGDGAEQSIISAFERIYQQEEYFDLVILIRGGGSQSDLNCFNSFDLAMNIAQFPIPVITGIGHERDETIADLVANTSMKTPTAVAEYLIDLVLEFASYIDQLGQEFNKLVKNLLQREQLSIQNKANTILNLSREYLTEHKIHLNKLQEGFQKSISIKSNEEKAHLQLLSEKIKFQFRNKIGSESKTLENVSDRFIKSSKDFILRKKQALESAERTVKLLSPENIIARGYSLSYSEDKIIKSVNELSKGMVIRTLFKDGEVNSEVSEIKRKK